MLLIAIEKLILRCLKYRCLYFQLRLASLSCGNVSFKFVSIKYFIYNINKIINIFFG